MVSENENFENTVALDQQTKEDACQVQCEVFKDVSLAVSLCYKTKEQLVSMGENLGKSEVLTCFWYNIKTRTVASPLFNVQDFLLYFNTIEKFDLAKNERSQHPDPVFLFPAEHVLIVKEKFDIRNLKSNVLNCAFAGSLFDLLGLESQLYLNQKASAVKQQIEMLDQSQKTMNK